MDRDNNDAAASNKYTNASDDVFIDPEVPPFGDQSRQHEDATDHKRTLTYGDVLSDLFSLIGRKTPFASDHTIASPLPTRSSQSLPEHSSMPHVQSSTETTDTTTPAMNNATNTNRQRNYSESDDDLSGGIGDFGLGGLTAGSSQEAPFSLGDIVLGLLADIQADIHDDFDEEEAKEDPVALYKLLMLGLDGAGKTTLLYQLKLGEVVNAVETVGFNSESLEYEGFGFTVWDLGGKQAYRHLWPKFFNRTQGIIYVMDSSDRARVDESKHELYKVLQDERLSKLPLLILANKLDLPNTLTSEEVGNLFDLGSLDRPCHVQEVSAVWGEGLAAALDWLVLENLSLVPPLPSLHSSISSPLPLINSNSTTSGNIHATNPVDTNTTTLGSIHSTNIVDAEATTDTTSIAITVTGIADGATDATNANNDFNNALPMLQQPTSSTVNCTPPVPDNYNHLVDPKLTPKTSMTVPASEYVSSAEALNQTI